MSAGHHGNWQFWYSFNRTLYTCLDCRPGDQTRFDSVCLFLACVPWPADKSSNCLVGATAELARPAVQYSLLMVMVCFCMPKGT